MVAYASARRVATALVAITAATSAGTPSAYAQHHDHPGVKRLWSQFPLGPQLRAPATTQAPPTQRPRPSTSAHIGASARGTASDSPHISWWPWPAIASAAGVLLAAIAALGRRRRSRRPAAPPGDGGVVPRPARTDANPVQPAASPPPVEHPRLSRQPHMLDTLPRAELFEMANALGFENTVLMSREDLIDLLSPRAAAAGTTSSGVSDRALARYAAAYAAACREGNPAPILAVTALVSPTTDDPTGHSKRMIAEARRRDLLTSLGPGKPGGELTARAKALLENSAPESPPSSRR